MRLDMTKTRNTGLYAEILQMRGGGGGRTWGILKSAAASNIKGLLDAHSLRAQGQEICGYKEYEHKAGLILK